MLGREFAKLHPSSLPFSALHWGWPRQPRLGALRRWGPHGDPQGWRGTPTSHSSPAVFSHPPIGHQEPPSGQALKIPIGRGCASPRRSFLEKLFNNINEELMSSLELQIFFTFKAKTVNLVVRSGMRLKLLNSKHQSLYGWRRNF